MYLEDTLDVDGLAGVAAFSRHCSHHQFSLLLDVNVRRYVQLLCLEHAAYQPAYRDDARITDITLACGYEGLKASVQAFHRQAG